MAATSRPDTQRYERKFLVSDISDKEIGQVIRFHPAGFREVFQQRFINNIYFDTLGFNNYIDNVEGEMRRWKCRIRWYGNIFGMIEKPVLELKIKNGLMGHKESYRLQGFLFDREVALGRTIAQVMKRSDVSSNVCALVLSLKPVLLNRYSRRYFISADKNFRVTIDTGLEYYSVSPLQNTFLNHYIDRRTVVVELKYDPQRDLMAAEIASLFPFPLTKSSKYLQGLEKVML